MFICQKDRVTQSHQGYGFIEFMGEEDADYAIKIMNMIKLYGKPIRVNKVKCNTLFLNSYISKNESRILYHWILSLKFGSLFHPLIHHNICVHIIQEMVSIMLHENYLYRAHSYECNKYHIISLKQ